MAQNLPTQQEMVSLCAPVPDISPLDSLCPKEKNQICLNVPRRQAVLAENPESALPAHTDPKRAHEIAHPPRPQADPANVLRLRSHCPAQPGRVPNTENRTSSENCRKFRALRTQAWGRRVPRGRAPQGQAERSRPNGLVVGRGSQGEQAGLPFRPWAGGRRRRGRREQETLIPLRAALAASLQPGLRRGCGSLPAARPLPPPPARLSGRNPGPGVLAAQSAGAAAWKVHGWPAGAAAARAAAAPGRRRRPRGEDLEAAGWARAARGSARAGAKEKVRPRPGGLAGAALSPPGSTAVPGERVRTGPSGAEGAGGGGGRSEGGPAGTQLREAPAPGRPSWAAGGTEERPPPRGAPLGNELRDRSSEPRKTSPFYSPRAAAVPRSPALPRARGAGGRRPAPPPPPPPRLGVSLLCARLADAKGGALAPTISKARNMI
ncbi:collagen alpha-1(I) chain-like [Desmodus rotundus]|uniref:collagen alpha-1(I) chain-like n=1 Tax=Desmodus rotundus TaxID=9430 RepID=UPI0039E3862D